MSTIRKIAAAGALTVTLLTGCGSDAGLHSPVSGTVAEADVLDPLEELVASDALIGLPWREALQMAHDVMAHDDGFFTQTYFPVEGEPFPMTADLNLWRLRIIVEGGEKAGTVSYVIHG